ncbi:MAG: hypothetical protein ABR599_08275 [Gemmatimonadota bacterium]
MTKLSLSMLVLALAIAWPPPAANAQEIQLQPFRPQEDLAQDPEAARAFSSFSRGWSGRDADRIAGLIAPDGRASVAIESRGVSSQMSRGQIEALLSGLFSDVERSAFDLSTVEFSDESSAYAVGDWTYESRRPSSRQRETVFVVFREAPPGTWVLSELRIRPAR